MVLQHPSCHPRRIIIESMVCHKIRGGNRLTLKQDRENLARVKLALAEKYENLAGTIKSQPRGRIISATPTSFAVRQPTCGSEHGSTGSERFLS